MRVKVRPLYKNGRLLPKEVLNQLPPVVGELEIAEERDFELARPVLRARLFNPQKGTPHDLLPELSDARLLHAKEDKLRLTGVERIEESNFAQTWAVEFD